MKYGPRVGEDFPLYAGVNTEKANYLRECVRSVVAITVLGVAVVALLVATTVWAFGGGTSALGTVWNYAALPLGLVIGHYFSPRHSKHDQGDEA